MKKKYTYNISTVVLTAIILELFLLSISIWYIIQPSSILSIIGFSEGQFKFDREWIISITLFLPIFTGLFIYVLNWKNKALTRFSTENLLRTIVPSVSILSTTSRYVFLRIGLFLLLIALASPQYGTQKRTKNISGIEIMICLDVSRSMEAKDYGSEGPDRLQQAQQALKTLVENLEGNKIGLVVFAGEALMQIPLTTDYSAIKRMINLIDTDVISAQGTAIGEALTTASSSFNLESTAQKVIIVVTDGENHEKGALKAAEKLNKKGVIITTIGLGSVTGSPIPEYDIIGRQVGYKKDKEGLPVLTKLNEKMLKDLARSGKGNYIKGNEYGINLRPLSKEIEKMNKADFKATSYDIFVDQYQLFLFPGIICLILFMMISDRQSRFGEKINLFD